MPVYTDPLAWSGQFAHCSLPLRLDSYRGCGFSCTYCFARARGGNVPEKRIIPAFPSFLARAFERADDGSSSVIAQALRRRIPVHFGGMSDPFQPAEQRHRVTLEFLKALCNRKYPTIISTKGELAADLTYQSLLKGNPNTIIQVSLVSTSDDNAKLIEPNATPPTRLLRLMERLSKAGLIVTCRLQPYLGGVVGKIGKYVDTVASAGAKQISIEHLKVPIEGVSNRIIEAARVSYLKLGARRDGREYVLPASSKRDTLFEMQTECRRAGVYFGSADNDYQFLSDSWACCSGADLFPGFENYYRFQIGYAVRQSVGRDIRFATIHKEWRPSGSIDRYLNSKTRMSFRVGIPGTVDAHIKYRWNSPAAPGSPSSFAGVIATERFDEDGNRVYSWADYHKNRPPPVHSDVNQEKLHG
jgi:DNA repair photolyase